MIGEMTHAELERHHYQAVRENPLYALMGMMDVEREWLEMNIPPAPDFSEVENRLNGLEELSQLKPKEIE